MSDLPSFLAGSQSVGKATAAPIRRYRPSPSSGASRHMSSHAERAASSNPPCNPRIAASSAPAGWASGVSCTLSGWASKAAFRRSRSGFGWSHSVSARDTSPIFNAPPPRARGKSSSTEKPSRWVGVFILSISPSSCLRPAAHALGDYALDCPHDWQSARRGGRRSQRLL